MVKRALVLSGGGSKGAYQVGALKYLLVDEKREYDCLCGVSVGAINIAHLAHYGEGQGLEAVSTLEDLWRGLTTEQVYKRWFPFGKLHAAWQWDWCKCMRRPSVYDSRPLRKFIDAHLDPEKVRAVGKKLRFGAVCLDTGKYRGFTEEDPDMLGAVLASSSYPMFLTPVEVDGELWSDGGLVNVTPLKEAIDLGAEVIDVIMTQPPAHYSELKDPSGLDNGMRSVDIMVATIVEDDIKIAMMTNRLAELGEAPGKRKIEIRLLRPEESLRCGSLTFKPENSARLIQTGYTDAKKAWGKGE
jgi:NTE family protein